MISIRVIRKEKNQSAGVRGAYSELKKDLLEEFDGVFERLHDEEIDKDRRIYHKNRGDL